MALAPSERNARLCGSLFGVCFLLQFREGSVFRGKLLPMLTRNRALRPRRSPFGLVSQCPIVRATVSHVASQRCEADIAVAPGALTFDTQVRRCPGINVVGWV